MKTQEEIEKLAEQEYPIQLNENHHKPDIYDDLNEEQRIAFKIGYNKSQEDMADKKYTEADIRKAIELARETESVRRGALSEDWDDIEKYDEMDIIYLLNKQD